MTDRRGEAGGASDQPLISCLCVTERRAAFMPWLLWSFDRQTWPHRELIIVDSSSPPFQSSRPDVRVHGAAPGSNIPDKRNQALRHARGSLIAWFDDDDWQHPERLERLARALAGGAALAGGTRSWFVDLHGHGCRSYDGQGAMVFNGAGFRRELAAGVSFDVGRRRASDTTWMQAITARAGTAVAKIDQVPLTLWLCHAQNISNPRTRGSYPVDLDVLRRQVGPQGWEETDHQLDRLRLALPAPAGGAPLRPSFAAESSAADGAAHHGDGGDQRHHRPNGDLEAGRARDPRARRMANDRLRRTATPPTETIQAAPPAHPAHPARRSRPAPARATSSGAPTSFIVFATPADARHLEVVVPHLVRQARYPFRETLGVHGADSSAGGAAEVGAALERLRRAAVLDRLLGSQALIDGGWSQAGQLHALPARAVVQALDDAVGEYVVVTAANQLVHASGGSSWVDQAVRALQRDPGLLLVEPHPGPPAGASGTARSLGLHAAGRRWDAGLRIWRAPHSLGQTFVARRDGLLRALCAGHGPADASLGAALSDASAARATCGILDTKGVWALSVRGAPFAAAAAQLCDTIEQGLFPPSQCGRAELVLGGPEALRPWQALRRPDAGSDDHGPYDEPAAPSMSSGVSAG
jgi:hypothetical protein